MACVVLHFLQFVQRSLPAPAVVDIGSGWHLKKIALTLEQGGVISSAFWFALLARAPDRGFIKAGEYHFAVGDTPLVVLQRLYEGRVVFRRLVVPEGFNLREIAALMKTQGWPRAMQQFSAPGVVKSLPIASPSLEGWLFPETYFYQKGATIQSMVARMVARSVKVLDEEWGKRPATTTLSRYEVLILASVIEKETGRAEERGRISGVFHNRLRLAMKLQSDPTVVYGIANFNGNITLKHLHTPTPYNTYTIVGLPPTPICSPGRAAIHAALFPEKTASLYFVARGDGAHVFSQTYAEHDANVGRYQRKKR